MPVLTIRWKSLTVWPVSLVCVDGSNGKRTSLGACSRDEAEQIVLAKNQALRQPALNLQIARAYQIGQLLHTIGKWSTADVFLAWGSRGCEYRLSPLYCKMKITTFIFGMVLTALTFVPGKAQTSTVTTTTTTVGSSASEAVSVAKDGVDSSLRDRIVSVYGVGTPAAIQSWWVIFYDPSVPSHGRAVKVANGQITRTYEAKGGVVYADTLTFSRAQVTGEGPALAAAQNYAAEHALAYDHVRALLRVTAQGQSFRWRVQLLNGPASKGFVFVNAADGTFAMYAPPGSIPTREGTGTGGGIAGDAQRAANDVKNTFLGIGGDLQEFFTGERTVDQ